jgi:hypothetical protein
VNLLAGQQQPAGRSAHGVFEQTAKADVRRTGGSYGKYSLHQIDAIKGIETVKALGAESSLREKMLGEFHSLAGKQFKSNFLLMSYEGTVNSATPLATANVVNPEGGGEHLVRRHPVRMPSRRKHTFLPVPADNQVATTATARFTKRFLYCRSLESDWGVVL